MPFDAQHVHVHLHAQAERSLASEYHGLESDSADINVSTLSFGKFNGKFKGWVSALGWISIASTDTIYHEDTEKVLIAIPDDAMLCMALTQMSCVNSCGDNTGKMFGFIAPYKGKVKPLIMKTLS